VAPIPCLSTATTVAARFSRKRRLTARTDPPVGYGFRREPSRDSPVLHRNTVIAGGRAGGADLVPQGPAPHGIQIAGEVDAPTDPVGCQRSGCRRPWRTWWTRHILNRRWRQWHM